MSLGLLRLWYPETCVVFDGATEDPVRVRNLGASERLDSGRMCALVDGVSIMIADLSTSACRIDSNPRECLDTLVIVVVDHWLLVFWILTTKSLSYLAWIIDILGIHPLM